MSVFEYWLLKFIAVNPSLDDAMISQTNSIAASFIAFAISMSISQASHLFAISSDLNVFNKLQHGWLRSNLTGPTLATAYHLCQNDVLSRVGGYDG